MRRRGMRKGFVQRNEHFWAAIIENDTQVGSNVLRFSPIVSPTDWVVRAGQTTATLVRIRGHVNCGLNNGGNPGGAILGYAVIVVDADDAVNFNPFTLASYLNHDVLWTRTASLGQYGTATEGCLQATDNFSLDIKVRRKLKPDDFVYLVTFCAPTVTFATDEDIRLTAILRGLVVVK